MANINFICRADHTDDVTNRAGPTITLNEGLWSYCGRGACDHHEWERIPATTLAEIQVGAYQHIVITAEPRA